jgi:3-methyladenine DNA glycosylase AlkD
MEKELQEVERALKKLADKTRATHDARYYNTRFICLGLNAKSQQSLFKNGYSFSELDHTTQKKIWNFIFKNAKTHEAMNQALMYFDARRDQLEPADWRVLKSWASRVENWVHSDTLCGIYSRLHEQYPELVYPQLLTWNRAKNPWLRRISIVSLIYYVSPNRKAPSVLRVFPLVTSLIRDKDPYVQKGVGWTLRECYKLRPESTFAFLKHYIKDLAPTSFSYATEKVTKKEKETLKKLRKG